MAIDSHEKRKSMISFGDPSNEFLPEADLTPFDAADQALFLKLFYEEVAFLPQPIDVFFDFTLDALNPVFTQCAPERLEFCLSIGNVGIGEAVPIFKKIELWQGSSLVGLTDSLVNFNFIPLETGQSGRILSFSNGVFTQRISGNLSLNISAIADFRSLSSLPADIEFQLIITSGVDVVSSDSVGFSFAETLGSHRETINLFANINSAINNTFQVRATKIQGGSLAQLDLTDIKLFIRDLN